MGVFLLLVMSVYVICSVISVVGCWYSLRGVACKSDQGEEFEGFIVSTVLSFLLMWAGVTVWQFNVTVLFLIVGVIPSIVPVVVGVLFLKSKVKFSAGAFATSFFGFLYTLIALDVFL